jgi:regulator of sigma E protease
VVFVHELGHFIMARLAGIDVVAFSLGWGPPVLHKRIGGVDYRLGAFPVGGYCAMKGDGDYEKVWRDRKDGQPPEAGTYYGVSAPRRILAAAGGPLFNLIFAVIALSVISAGGREIKTLANRIVLQKDISGQSYPADRAGLETGDYIIAVNGKKTETSQDVQKIVASSAKKPLLFTIMRDGAEMQMRVEPSLEKSTGAGKIGVYFWSEPVIETLAAGGPAEQAGLLPGDKILRWGGEDVPYSAAVYKIYARADIPAVIPVEYERAGDVHTTEIANTGENGSFGIGWPYIVHKTPPPGFFGAIAHGATLAVEVFVVSARSLGLLFQGIDLTKAISGPVRISYIAGDILTENLSGDGLSAALQDFFEFLALISIALALMNLLPLPILDGGAIVLFLAEIATRKLSPPRFVAALQMIGVVLIAALMLLAVYGDIMFFFRK